MHPVRLTLGFSVAFFCTSIGYSSSSDDRSANNGQTEVHLNAVVVEAAAMTGTEFSERLTQLFSLANDLVPDSTCQLSVIKTMPIVGHIEFRKIEGNFSWKDTFVMGKLTCNPVDPDTQPNLDTQTLIDAIEGSLARSTNLLIEADQRPLPRGSVRGPRGAIIGGNGTEN